ncbi:MAG TPA: HEAT repeat domain-containing protein, partial [Gammaproteobacteria bacterium]|nr:HEAT repeat domain-containing protein [Gammaproteobacteria bacterium]
SLRDRSTVLLEAQATALDTALPDRVRVSALMKLVSGLTPMPEAHDTAVVAAAFEIATKSSDPDARASAWLWIGRLGVEPPQVLPSLLSALERDSADEVRSTAARVLADFLHEPGVAEALARAAAEDPQERPAAPCCLLTVREAARRALLADEEPRAAVRKILFDESLPPHDRLMLVAANGRFSSLRELGDDAAQAVFTIGANTADPDIRGTAWYWLRGAHSASFAPTLLDDLARHPSEQVRARAAAALTPYSDDPAVSAALARALRDPAESVQKAAREVLEGTPP